MKDLYFTQSYGQLYESIEGGKCEVYNFQHSLGEILHVYIKKEIPISIDDKLYFEIVTPFAFGGPVIKNCRENNKKELLSEFQKAFKNYCDSTNIICEIVHFHPAIANAEDFNSFYDVCYIGNTIGTNLSDWENPIQEEFSDSCKKIVFAGLEKGVSYKVTASPYNPNYYKDIFFSIVKDDNENNYKLFNKDYLAGCFEISRKNTVIVEAIYRGRTIGICVNLLFDNILQPQLSATLSKFDYLTPLHIMQYGLANWGKQNGVDIIHNGGGNALGDEDNLYLFKKQFGSLNFKYFLGKKIWNEEIYEKLCKSVGLGIEAEYFPAYRISEQLLVEEETSVRN